MRVKCELIDASVAYAHTYIAMFYLIHFPAYLGVDAGARELVLNDHDDDAEHAHD